MTDGFETLLLNGLAVYLAAQSVGTWKPTTAYTSGETAIVIGKIPQDPGRVIALNSYAVSDHASLSDSVRGVQIRTRWDSEDKRKVDDLDALIFNLLHGKAWLRLTTGVLVVLSVRNSWATLGQDANDRWSNVANYYMTCHRPSTNRT